jgi:hypothetical protein
VSEVTDQAHSIRDFKTFTDRTPGENALELKQFQKMFRDNENVVFLQSPATMLDYTEDADNTNGGKRNATEEHNRRCFG